MKKILTELPCRHCGGFWRKQCTRRTGKYAGKICITCCATPGCKSSNGNKNHRNPQYRRQQALRYALNDMIRGGSHAKRPHPIWGYTRKELMDHLQAQFLPGMSWKNRGGKPGQWQIDHVVPLKNWNLKDPHQYKLANHLNNLRPIWRTGHEASEKGRVLLEAAE